MANRYRHYNKNIIKKFDNKKPLRVLVELQSLRDVCVINEAWNPEFNKITLKTVNCSLLNKYEPICKEQEPNNKYDTPLKPNYLYKVGQIKTVHTAQTS